MKEDSNIVKEYLFEHIKKSDVRYQQLFAQEKVIEIINNILENCYQKVSLMKNKEEQLGILATGIMHYTLTNVMIPSQRKVEYQGMELDIIIPDLKTLEKDAKKTLLIAMPKTADRKIIEDTLQQLEKIQSEKQNIWLVLSKDLGFKNKTFIIKKDGNFANIIYDIANFTNVHGSNKFKILRI